MQNELLDLIDQINDMQLTAECDVMTALSDTYQKALIISEQCDDTYVFNESLFMEAKSEKSKKNISTRKEKWLMNHVRSDLRISLQNLCV